MTRDLEVRAWCATQGLRVPVLLDHNLDEGWAVLEDFGPDDAEHVLENEPADERHERGLCFIRPLNSLAKLRSSDLPEWNPPLDGARMRWELAGFELWFIRHRLGMLPASAVGQWLDDLAAVIDEHPRRVCHRDYHLNNLFLLPDGEVGLIDYQDILIGPDTYDAVSLLGERGMPQLLSTGSKKRLQEAWATSTHAQPGWRERLRGVGIQRGLKVLGTFARLTAAGAGTYERWIEAQVHELGSQLAAADAPSELVDLLLD